MIEKEKMEEAERKAGPVPIMEVVPYQLKTAGLITTGNEVKKGIIKDTFSEVVIEKLKQYGISTDGKCAIQMTSEDYRAYDYIIAMERYNLRNMERFVHGDPAHKVHLLLDFTDRGGDIADPWYTGNFDETYDDVLEGCRGLLQYIREHVLQ